MMLKKKLKIKPNPENSILEGKINSKKCKLTTKTKPIKILVNV